MPSPPRVLVVDDEAIIRQLIVINLELEGFEVYTAANGWETAARIRQAGELAGVRIILLSARAQEADIERGHAIGVDAYLTKPFDPDDLVDTVRRLASDKA